MIVWCQGKKPGKASDSRETLRVPFSGYAVQGIEHVTAVVVAYFLYGRLGIGVFQLVLGQGMVVLPLFREPLQTIEVPYPHSRSDEERGLIRLRHIEPRRTASSLGAFFELLIGLSNPLRQCWKNREVTAKDIGGAHEHRFGIARE